MATAQRKPAPADLTAKARQRLIQAANGGGITLIIGAGVSVPRGIPNWEKLARAVWDEVMPDRPSPWEVAPAGRSPREIPQFLPIVLELVYRATGPDRFVELLRKHLYATCRFPDQEKSFAKSYESLAVLARAVVQESRRAAHRRIDAVITLNADDLLEQAVNRIVGRERPVLSDEIVRVVARSTHTIIAGRRRSVPIPVYHVHGFVPSNHMGHYGSYFDHMLVFTDTQYWAVSATAASFANRVVSSALSEGVCVFIGLSMTDINLLRWMAVRHAEMDRDVNSLRNLARPRVVTQRAAMLHGFSRHFWVRPASDDPSGLLSEFLDLRGVAPVEIGDWQSTNFADLVEACFPKPVTRRE